MNKSNNESLFALLVFVFILFFSLNCSAQENTQNQKSEFWSHVMFGGGIGLSFGDGFFSGTLAPSAIYRFDEKLGVGAGLNMSYNTEKNFYESYILGTSIIGLYNVIPQLQFSMEFEQLYVNRDFEEGYVDEYGNDPDESYWYPGLYLGAGFNAGNVTMGLRFDVLYDSDKSIYGNAYNPFVRFYF